ncbi:MAG: sigma-54 dependent transcriptional regulator [Gemmatimonadetes bacterium]|nr:sigma-54 dependent transcriptional regulator [Gemmatimonadota bacterium]
MKERSEGVVVLVVDDDQAHRETLHRHLSSMGHEVSMASSGVEALNRLAAIQPDIVLTDIRMPGGVDGFDVLKKAKAHAPEVDVVLLTGFASVQPAIDAIRDGASDFLLKPLDLDQVDEVMDRCVEDRRRRRDAVTPVDLGMPDLPSERLVGRHPKMVDIYKTVGALSKGRSTVLLRSETGTGKELIARAIHENSPARDEPFLAVNCAALPDSMLESELFGHVKGAFTGASSDRKGLFELAGSGTILLDEIGDTSPTFQAKLLRVLQEKEFHPVGGERIRTTNARVIASTNRDLARLVAEGEFREDLLFRLRVVEIELPPLRERKSDVPLLVGHFLQKVGRELGRPACGISRGAMAALMAHHWPGNVRELENTLARAVVLCRSSTVTLQDIAFADGPSKVRPESDGQTLADIERAHVQRVLSHAGGNKAEAARVLGISRPKLYRMVDGYDLTVQ